MKKILLFEMKSLYRDNMRVYGYLFGAENLTDCEKTIAVVSGIRGNEFTQIYEASQLVRQLIWLESLDRIKAGHAILVIPVVNPYSVNSEKRFWPTDNTDINRMLPGYDKGETTQRVAASLFEVLKGFRYGIHLASHYISGNFIPHVSIQNTGKDYTESARAFGLGYIHFCEPSYYDTTTLNYNWQVWDTETYTIYGGNDTGVDKEVGDNVVSSMLNFMNHCDILEFGHHRGYISSVIQDEDLSVIKSTEAGFFHCEVKTGDVVHEGQKVAEILHTGDGSVLSEINAPKDGIVFFVQSNPLAFANGQLMLIV
ncbi:MAG: succinylglutamate desuccinylase/aspartoacylase family protein [Firmicutes bacterium]|nr:succinylglutamate desuccinylase/aspartoacylase family protein [Bacillota bacterium]